MFFFYKKTLFLGILHLISSIFGNSNRMRTQKKTHLKSIANIKKRKKNQFLCLFDSQLKNYIYLKDDFNKIKKL
jgi:hypothetical protein